VRALVELPEEPVERRVRSLESAEEYRVLVPRDPLIPSSSAPFGGSENDVGGISSDYVPAFFGRAAVDL